jgi:indolepyruvate ferredoxin oxidoreductase alpha subunit
MCGELNPFLVEKGILGKKFKAPKPFFKEPLPPRPPNLCPGCPHRGVFHVLRKLKVFASGDIGCYTLGAYPPLNVVNSNICMGSSIGGAHGMAKALGEKGKGHHTREQHRKDNVWSKLFNASFYCIFEAGTS